MITYFTVAFVSNNKPIHKYIKVYGSTEYADNYIKGYKDALKSNKSVECIKIAKTHYAGEFVETMPLRRVWEDEDSTMTIKESDFADNSNSPKVLKLQDLDTWTNEELIDYINKIEELTRPSNPINWDNSDNTNRRL